MIARKHGVTITNQRTWADFGVEEVACDVRWLTEPGWLTLQVELPTLCMMATEIGGRCYFWTKPDQPVDGEYFGSGALALVGPSSPVVIHAAEMRQGRLCCFAFRTADASYLSSDASYLSSADIAAVGRLQSRYMFRNERIRTCAKLLDDGRIRGDPTPFIVSLSKVLFAAVVEVAHGDDRPSKGTALTGDIWDAISRYIRDHLDEPITIEALAGIAQMPPERFGAAFRQATDMSVRQWQMDHRVRSAQRLLTDNPNESLAEVAALCGFADQSHFSRAFLKVVGLTPTAWLHGRT